MTAHITGRQASNAVDWSSRIQAALQQQPDMSAATLIAGVAPEQQAQLAAWLPAQRTPAAVLLPIVQHASGWTMLFTQRASHLRRHAGQISFPGGRIEAQDVDAAMAALRETEEEIGLSRDHVRIVGVLPSQVVLTGYQITPVVGLVTPGFNLQLDSNEVSAVFEAPLDYLFDPANHQLRERQLQQLTVRGYDIVFGEHRIWGATAGILMNLYRLLNLKV